MSAENQQFNQTYAMFRDYLSGYPKKLTYEEWNIEIEKEFTKRKLSTSMLDKLIANIEMMENLEETLIYLKDKGYDLRILSGGIDYVIKSLLKDKVKYFSDIRCNHFYFDENGIMQQTLATEDDIKNLINQLILAISNFNTAKQTLENSFIEYKGSTEADPYYDIQYWVKGGKAIQTSLASFDQSMKDLMTARNALKNAEEYLYVEDYYNIFEKNIYKRSDKN